ncbi:MAG: tetratricopeptide repeat protein, partial [Desulfobulbales bacterium]|nr:tetratricopeptide repeat protein [Desulfobulbales bacterium]
DKAKPLLKEISERFPDFSGAPQALAALALCHYKENDCLNTVKYYQKLIERYPGNKLLAEAHFHLGLCFERLGNRQRATDSYEKVVENFPGTIYARQASEILSR